MAELVRGYETPPPLLPELKMISKKNRHNNADSDNDKFGSNEDIAEDLDIADKPRPAALACCLDTRLRALERWTRSAVDMLLRDWDQRAMADQQHFWNDTCQLQAEVAHWKKGSALCAPAPAWAKMEAEHPRMPAEATSHDEAKRASAFAAANPQAKAKADHQAQAMLAEQQHQADKATGNRAVANEARQEVKGAKCAQHAWVLAKAKRPAALAAKTLADETKERHQHVSAACTKALADEAKDWRQCNAAACVTALAKLRRCQQRCSPKNNIARSWQIVLRCQRRVLLPMSIVEGRRRNALRHRQQRHPPRNDVAESQQIVLRCGWRVLLPMSVVTGRRWNTLQHWQSRRWPRNTVAESWQNAP